MRFSNSLKTDFGLHYIDVIPVINIIFLIVIFFTFSSNVMVLPGMRVKLLPVFSATKMDRAMPVIAVDNAGVIYCDGAPQTIEYIEARLRLKPIAALFIKADSRVNLTVITRIWEMCKRLGIENVSMATTGDAQ